MTTPQARRSEALSRLPSNYAIALRLRHEGMERDRMAAVLGIDVEAVGPLLALGEAKLSKLLDELETGQGTEATPAEEPSPPT